MTFFLCLLGADPHAAAVHAASWALLLLLLCLEQLLLKCTRMLAFQVVMGEKGLSQLLLLLIARIKFLLPDNNLLPFLSLQVVMGEKGRSQLQRDMRESIYATIAGGCRFRQLEKDGTGSVCVCVACGRASTPPFRVRTGAAANLRQWQMWQPQQ